jgi:hypothetical protein
MITGILYQSYFSNRAKVILSLIVFSWAIFIYSTIKDGSNLITKISFSNALILMIVGPFIIKNIKSVGEIIFEKNQLVIRSNLEEVVFPLDEIHNLYIYYEGYKNQDDSNPYRPLSFKDGTENEIGFYHRKKKIHYKFQIPDEKFLGRLIRQWKYLKEPKIRIYHEDQKSKIIWTNYK